MKVIFSIILLIVLFILVYRIDKLEQFQAFSTSDIRDISRLECCGEGMQGPPGVTGPIGKSAYNVAYDLELAKGADKAYWTSLPEEERKSEWITSLTGPVGDSAYNVAYAAEQAKIPADRAYWFDETDKENGESKWLTSITGKVGEVGDSIPKGSIIAFHGETPPEGWKICNGRGTYEPLSGSGRVNIPDLSGRFILGAGQARDGSAITKIHDGSSYDSNSYTINDNGGWEQHSLTNDQMPRHRHMSLMRDPGRCDFHTDGHNAATGERSWENCPRIGDQPSEGEPDPYENIMVRGWINETIPISSRTGQPSVVSTDRAQSHTHNISGLSLGSGAKGIYSDHNTSMGYATWRNTRYNGGAANSSRNSRRCGNGDSYAWDKDGPDCAADGVAHNNMPPYYVLTYIIYVGDTYSS